MTSNHSTTISSAGYSISGRIICSLRPSNAPQCCASLAKQTLSAGYSSPNEAPTPNNHGEQVKDPQGEQQIRRKSADDAEGEDRPQMKVGLVGGLAVYIEHGAFT